MQPRRGIAGDANIIFQLQAVLRAAAEARRAPARTGPSGPPVRVADSGAPVRPKRQRGAQVQKHLVLIIPKRPAAVARTRERARGRRLCPFESPTLPADSAESAKGGCAAPGRWARGTFY
jgi:hypothetical protein